MVHLPAKEQIKPSAILLPAPITTGLVHHVSETTLVTAQVDKVIMILLGDMDGVVLVRINRTTVHVTVLIISISQAPHMANSVLVVNLSTEQTASVVITLFA